MSTLQRPAYLQNRAPSALSSVLAGGIGTAQPPRISLKDDRFTLVMPNGGLHPSVQPSLTIDVVVVGGNPSASRVYYDAAYDAADAAAPICWSDNGVGPSVGAGTPQSQTCDQCQWAVWGSKISANGSKIPACSTVKKVAVLVAGAGETVFLLSIPPGSLKPWRGFLAHLDTLGASIDELAVRLSLNDKTLGFEPVDFLPEAAYQFAQKVIASPEPDVVCGVKDKPRDLALPAPAVTPALGFGAASAGAASFAPAPQPAPAPPPETPEQREAREFLEFRAAKARAGQMTVAAPVGAFGAGPSPTPAQQSAPQSAAEPPALRQRAPRGSRKGETVVGPGPIPAGTFTPPQATPQPQGFIGGGTPTPAGFGMAPPTAPGSDIQNALARAFNMPLGG